MDRREALGGEQSAAVYAEYRLIRDWRGVGVFSGKSISRETMKTSTFLPQENVVITHQALSLYFLRILDQA